MKQYLVAAAIGLASAGAMADSGIYDPVTGKSWTFVQSQYILQTVAGYSVATQSQLDALVADLFGSTPLYAVSTTGSYPAAFTTFENALQSGANCDPAACTALFLTYPDGPTSSPPSQPYENYVDLNFIDYGDLLRTGGREYAVTLATNHDNLAALSGQRFSVALVSDMVTAVPEPATYALMLAGLGALGWMRRRQGGN